MGGKKKIFCEKCEQNKPMSDITPRMWRGSLKWVCYSCWPRDNKK